MKKLLIILILCTSCSTYDYKLNLQQNEKILIEDGQGNKTEIEPNQLEEFIKQDQI